MVQEIGEDFVRTNSQTIACGTVLWAAGVTTSAFGMAIAGRVNAKTRRPW